MRTPLTVAIGVLLVAGVVVGVTSAQASTDVPVQPIRVEAPAPAEPAAPVPAAPDPTGAEPVAPQVRPDPNGYVAPPPADDDDDDDDDDDGPDDDD